MADIHLNKPNKISSKFAPGKLWEAWDYFVGIDVEAQKNHELSQKYFGKPKEILLIVSTEGMKPPFRVWALINEKLILFPWYSLQEWNDKFFVVNNKVNNKIVRRGL